MKINPGTSGLAQNVSSRVSNILRASSSKIVRPIQMSSCAHNEY
ncbi:MAG: hypothetical protein UR34_C0011G0042 [candidate division WS6 bacterium GW2011_GWC1_33_20]|uniref:Uncharacterized protein n=2 Tax=Candidatus Dojkabacteria TaxID=74243 RepID=A0A0G0AUE7_9BACT|nr:MAG: hypothetical protein UR32_C0013G0004 [candidate division WS6 bacterium GW2011_GWE2_33_157]KKP43788.1 MAG: hypothetical protein UR34_C0011G0042 [candidate division WS6 bacterium GW2011_GWC1_33_20]KKP44837.1 MAG: hypothetical protein UR36_C0013G0005 [candidate division WS6 bacterium GW2011_GWF1_33_233]KKP54440.1 MAG: hypothetical protein UR45_C0015G0012 [candidate division WS6 bacterium GW2011_WS6_33_547]KKP55011.1 MAG: hypothetical protein UR47_C0006G0004 [candidate division WS6 bacteriu